MKVLHVIQRYPPAVGGSETWCAEIGRYLGTTGDEVRVLTLDVLEEAHYWADPGPGERPHRLGRFDWDGPVRVERCRRSLPRPLVHRWVFERLLDRGLGVHAYGPHSVDLYRRLFSRARWADVVHLHTLPYPHNFVGYLAAWRHGKRVAITPYFHPGHPHYERRANYWLLRRCDTVFALTRYERDHLVARGIPRERVVVTGCGVHPGRYAMPDAADFRARFLECHGLPPGTKLVLYLGRKAEYKGLPVLVDALARCETPGATLVLAGPSLPWFEGFWAALPDGVRQRVIDVGQVSHETKVGLLHAARALVLPSPFESFGIVFLESWVCGTPVIGSDAPPVAELIGDAGLTFRAGDAADLADKLDRLLDDDRLAARAGARGRQRALREFRWERLGQRVRRAYQGRGDDGLRILLCTNLFPPYSVGGSEVVAYKQARALQALGHEVRIFAGRLVDGLSRRYAISTERGEFETTWVRLAPEDLGGRTQGWRNDIVQEEFARVLEIFGPDLVHFHNVTGLGVHVVEACRARRIPSVMTLHDFWGICFKNLMIKNDGHLCRRGGYDCLGCLEVLSGQPPLPTPVRNAHLLLALLQVDRFVSPSAYLADRFVENGLPRERVVVVRNGIDVQNFRPAERSREPFTVGCVGQLVPHKGVHVFLRALTRLSRRHGVRALVVGDGDDGPRLRALAEELGLGDVATFTGRIDNREIAGVFEQLDVLVVPSLWPENSPVTITEAMATGLPVIASNLGGVPELVEDGVTGFLVPPGDPAALAARIEALRGDPEARAIMGRNGRARIEEHGIDQQVARLLELYAELLGQGARPAPIDADIVLFHAEAHWNVPIRDLVHAAAAAERERPRRLLLCRADLADESILEVASVLVLPSGGSRALSEALRALLRGIPVLVPDAPGELRALCVTAQAGLFYGTAAELQACLALMLADDALRAALGENGRRFVLTHGSRALELVGQDREARVPGGA